MKVVYDPGCLKHDPPYEILSSKMVPYLESPVRIGIIRGAIERYPELFEIVGTNSSIDLESSLLAVHSKEYLRYLETAYESWVRDGGDKTCVLPEAFPHPAITAHISSMQSVRASPIASAGMYCFDLSCPITADTWGSILASARVALTGALILHSETQNWGKKNTSVFSLTRPPGHHAGSSICGGYCFINIAAASVRYLQRLSPDARVAILDIDYHHGNGTQEIFYNDPSALYVSLHAANDYPYFTGSTAETGLGPGQGFNINMPLKRGQTGDDEYCAALKTALEHVKTFEPAFLLVSFGVDTYEDDPLGDFQLTTQCYRRIGGEIASAQLPTLVIMEGGYHLESLGDNVVALLTPIASG